MDISTKKYIKGANPYMPLWEHVPDGEPRLFEYNGEKRVYVYGSHDTLKTAYCGDDQVVWSAPADDLTNWTCHGTCYKATDGSILYAPDVVQKGDTFYLYAAEGCGSRIMVAKSKNPAGPFTDPVKTDLGFDPGILVDDDGRVYAYWGFCKSYCCELNDDMATIKDGTFRENPLLHCQADWAPQDDCVDKVNGFFEASSPRKINGKYVYLYSKRCNTPHPKQGVDFDCNGYLSYFYSDKPLEGFVWGGDISFNGGEILEMADGTYERTYQWGNNHGGLVCVNNQWYIFYHRHTGTDEYSRQGMIEKVEVAEDKSGKLYIGKILRDESGEPVGSEPVEMTSSGVQTEGLDAKTLISAGFACHIYGSKLRAYVAPVYDKTESVSAPVMNITDGTTVGFRYLNMGQGCGKVYVEVEALADIELFVRVDNYKGKIVGQLDLHKGQTTAEADLSEILEGKQALYFEFKSNSEGAAVAVFNRFSFE